MLEELFGIHPRMETLIREALSKVNPEELNNERLDIMGIKQGGGDSQIKVFTKPVGSLPLPESLIPTAKQKKVLYERLSSSIFGLVKVLKTKPFANDFRVFRDCLVGFDAHLQSDHTADNFMECKSFQDKALPLFADIEAALKKKRKKKLLIAAELDELKSTVDACSKFLPSTSESAFMQISGSAEDVLALNVRIRQLIRGEIEAFQRELGNRYGYTLRHSDGRDVLTSSEESISVTLVQRESPLEGILQKLFDSLIKNKTV